MSLMHEALRAIERRRPRALVNQRRIAAILPPSHRPGRRRAVLVAGAALGVIGLGAAFLYFWP